MEADVIIVGAGPTGLMLAGELGLAGVRPLVLERQPQIRDIPKAGGLSGQILQLLRYRGELERFEAASTAPKPAPRSDRQTPRWGGPSPLPDPGAPSGRLRCGQRLRCGGGRVESSGLLRANGVPASSRLVPAPQLAWCAAHIRGTGPSGLRDPAGAGSKVRQVTACADPADSLSGRGLPCRSRR
jgi:FAD binding domain